MRRRLLLAGVAAGITVGSVTALPAFAAAPSVSLSSPSSGAVLAVSTPSITGEAAMSNGIVTEVLITVTSTDGHPVPAPEKTVSNDANVRFSWSPLLRYNGRYTVTARATGEDRPVDSNGAESNTASRGFAIAAPPQPPQNVRASADSSRVVTVTWSANSEPDLLFYQVQRSVGESTEWVVAGEVGRDGSKPPPATFADARTAEQGGEYRYRVAAARQGLERDKPIGSDPSRPTASISVSDPPRSATTTTAPGSAGSGDAGPSGDGGTGGGTGSDSGSGAASGSGAGSSGSGPRSGSNVGPVITRSGSVDLSSFRFLDQTRTTTIETIPQPDPGFDENLPFGPVRPGDDEEVSEDEVAGPTPLTGDSDSDLHRSLSFVAASLLATVLFMHLLWLKGEVDRAPLEALPPEGPPSS